MLERNEPSYISESVEDIKNCIYERLEPEDQVALSLASSDFYHVFHVNYNNILIRKLNRLLTKLNLPTIQDRDLAGVSSADIQHLIYAYQYINYTRKSLDNDVFRYAAETTHKIKNPEFWRLLLMSYMLKLRWNYQQHPNQRMTVTSENIVAVSEFIYSLLLSKEALFFRKNLDLTKCYFLKERANKLDTWIGDFIEEKIEIRNNTFDVNGNINTDYRLKHQDQILAFTEHLPEKIKKHRAIDMLVDSFLCSSQPVTDKFIRLLVDRRAVDVVVNALADTCGSLEDCIYLISYDQEIREFIQSIQDQNLAEQIRRTLLNYFVLYYLKNITSSVFLRQFPQEKMSIILNLAKEFKALDPVHTRIVVLAFLTSSKPFYIIKERIIKYFESADRLTRINPKRMKEINNRLGRFDFVKLLTEQKDVFDKMVKLDYGKSEFWDTSYKFLDKNNIDCFYQLQRFLPEIEKIEKFSERQLRALMKLYRASKASENTLEMVEAIFKNNMQLELELLEESDYLLRRYSTAIALDQLMVRFFYHDPKDGLNRLKRLGQAGNWLGLVKAGKAPQLYMSGWRNELKISNSWLSIVLGLPVALFDVVCLWAGEISLEPQSDEHKEATDCFYVLGKEVPLIRCFTVGIESESESNLYAVKEGYACYRTIFDKLDFETLQLYANLILSGKEYASLLEFLLVLFQCTVARNTRFPFIPLQDAVYIVEFIVGYADKNVICEELQKYPDIKVFISKAKQFVKNVELRRVPDYTLNDTMQIDEDDVTGTKRALEENIVEDEDEKKAQPPRKRLKPSNVLSASLSVFSVNMDNHLKPTENTTFRKK